MKRSIRRYWPEFDDSLWADLVESVTVYGKEEVTFLFKGGTEIEVG